MNIRIMEKETKSASDWSLEMKLIMRFFFSLEEEEEEVLMIIEYCKEEQKKKLIY